MDAEPAEEPGVGGEEEVPIPPYIAALLQPLTARLGAIEQFMAASTGGHTPTPPPQTRTPTVSGTDPVTATPGVAAAPTGRQEDWLRLIERYQKLKAPNFQGTQTPLVADKWKEDVGSILSHIGVGSVQRQRLAAFYLRGDASRWYRSKFSEHERLTMSWEEFIRRFDDQYIYSAVRAGKEAELITLEQGACQLLNMKASFRSCLTLQTCSILKRGGPGCLSGDSDPLFADTWWHRGFIHSVRLHMLRWHRSWISLLHNGERN